MMKVSDSNYSDFEGRLKIIKNEVSQSAAQMAHSQVMAHPTFVQIFQLATEIVRESYKMFNKRLIEEYKVGEHKSSAEMAINSLKNTYFYHDHGLFGQIREILNSQNCNVS